MLRKKVGVVVEGVAINYNTASLLIGVLFLGRP
jgi:hypothetical protein